MYKQSSWCHFQTEKNVLLVNFSRNILNKLQSRFFEMFISSKCLIRFVYLNNEKPHIKVHNLILQKQEFNSRKKKTKTVNKWPSVVVYIVGSCAHDCVYFSQELTKRRKHQHIKCHYIWWSHAVLTKISKKRKKEYCACNNFGVRLQQQTVMKCKKHYVIASNSIGFFFHPHCSSKTKRKKHVKQPRVFWQIYDMFRATARLFHYRITAHNEHTGFDFSSSFFHGSNQQH